MSVEITIQLSQNLADRYQKAPGEVREKAQLLLNVLLDELTLSSRPLSAIMDEISDNARARGLTPDVLDALLEEE